MFLEVGWSGCGSIGGLLCGGGGIVCVGCWFGSGG